jgi:hypothetical protein
LAIVVAVFVLARGPRVHVSLTVIAGARSSAGGRSFYLLPSLFLLWSNLDMQFVYGLMALVRFLITGVIANFAERKAPQQENLHTPWRATLIVTAASFTATLCNPYGFHL